MPIALYLDEACLLDQTSGAASSTAALLRVLATRGWCCHALTLSVMARHAAVYHRAQWPELDGKVNAGTVVNLLDGPLSQRVVVTQSDDVASLTLEEEQAFLQEAEATLTRLAPEVLLTVGSTLMTPLVQRARALGSRTVLLLRRAQEVVHARFDPSLYDERIAPTQWMAERCKAATGREVRVVGDIVERFLDGKRNLLAARIARRRERFITMVNPSPAKGGMFFLRLVAKAVDVAPDLRFRAVGGDWSREDWRRQGVEDDILDRVDWLPVQQHMATVYAQAALLLVPSIAADASSRVIPEALLAGIPVLAMRRGNVPEQLNSGGFLFPLPPVLERDPLATFAEEDCLLWLNAIRMLMRDDDFYRRAVELALAASRIHEPELRATNVATVFAELHRGHAAMTEHQGRGG